MQLAKSNRNHGSFEDFSFRDEIIEMEAAQIGLGFPSEVVRRGSFENHVKWNERLTREEMFNRS